eukprot:SAG25_NODE_8536_length_417_cov_0.764151_2_plen_22_part_01
MDEVAVQCTAHCVGTEVTPANT